MLLAVADSSHASPASCRPSLISTNMLPAPGFFGVGNLVGVAAGSASNVWAVGYVSDGTKQQLETWHWNGRSWTPVGSKFVAGSPTPLFAVAARGGDAWAVGGRLGDRTIVLHSRRGTWTAPPVPAAFRKTGLTSVAIVSPRDVWAVGGFAGTSRVLHWNGKGWSQHLGPDFHLSDGGAYRRVARIPGTAQVWVTGTDGEGGLTSARWSGSSWELLDLPTAKLGGDGAIAAASVASAWLATATSSAGQRQRSGLLQWDGSAWTAVAVPNPAPFDEILGVAARSANDAWAVGEYSPHAGLPYRDSRSWVLHWDGSAWSQLQAPPGQGLNAVTLVPGTNDVWAVGGSIAVRYRC